MKYLAAPSSATLRLRRTSSSGALRPDYDGEAVAACATSHPPRAATSGVVAEPATTPGRASGRLPARQGGRLHAAGGEEVAGVGGLRAGGGRVGEAA